MREIGILVFVFAPLDAALTERSARAEDIATILVGAMAMIIAGNPGDRGLAMHFRAWLAVLAGGYLLGAAGFIL